MEEKYRLRLSETMLQDVLARYGVEKAQEVGGFENFIYEIKRGGEDEILRLAHSSRRSRPLIEAEVDWINYLAGHGVPVAAALDSDQGKLVEAIDDGEGEQFLATAFEKAPGVTLRQSGLGDEPLYRRYGELLGRMHALTGDYQPPAPDVRRFEWDDPITAYAHKSLPPSEAAAKGQYTELLAFLRHLPKNREDYGLIHYDAHGSNLLVDAEGGLTLIDFDDSAYGWFMLDLAIVLFYISYPEEEPERFARAFLPPFLEGYARHNRLDPDWLRILPYFLKLREIELYAVIHRDMDVENLEHPRVIAFMEGRHERIGHGAPFLEMSFEPFEKYLRG